MTTNKTRVGFIGLGTMGSPMASNIANSNEFDLALYDVDPAADLSHEDRIRACPRRIAGACLRVRCRLVRREPCGRTGGGHEMSTAQAVAALLHLAGPALSVEQVTANTVRFGVFSAKSKRGKMMLPLTFKMEVELFVQLDENRMTYSFSGRSFETSGFSMSTESFRGVYRRREWGRVLTWDGVVPVKFDTGVVFDRIEQVLIPHGWKSTLR